MVTLYLAIYYCLAGSACADEGATWPVLASHYEQSEDLCNKTAALATGAMNARYGASVVGWTCTRVLTMPPGKPA